jgi:2-polyprenyl-3-methyl-5-hydroxy-6-metoxy-1,4-benzoquinol methylase
LTVEVDPRWYDGFFDREWLEFRNETSPAERTESEVDFLLEALDLEPGARILDVACGHGRHSLELARRGFRVTGLDLSEPSIEIARADAAADGLEVEFLHADMREIAFAGAFDAAINLFTAFGYLESEAEDQKALDAIARSLRSGGRFFMETIDAVRLLRVYRPENWNEHADGTLMLEQRAYDYLTGRNDVVWIFVRQDGSRSELRHSLRLYTPAELASMFRRSGIEIERAWASWEGAELELTAPGIRLLLLGRKA